MEATPTPTPTPEVSQPLATLTPEIKFDSSKQVAELLTATPKTGVDKPKETPADAKPTLTNALFPPVIITIPPPDTSKVAAKETVAKPDPTPVQAETKALNEQKPDTSKSTKTANIPSLVGASRPRVIDSVVGVKPCTLTASDEIVTLNKGGPEMAIIIGLEDDGELDGLTATSNNPKNVSVFRKVIENVTTRGIFVVKSISLNTGMYQIKFEMPCGTKQVLVKVK